MVAKDQNTEEDLIILSDDDTQTETFSDDVLDAGEISGAESVISFDSEADSDIEVEPREASNEMILDEDKKESSEEETIDFGDLEADKSDDLVVEEPKKEETLSNDGYSFGGANLGGVETMESILEDTIAKLNSRKEVVDADTTKEKDHIKDLEEKVKGLQSDIKEAEGNVKDLDAESSKIVNNITDLETMKKAASSKTPAKK